MSKEIAQNFIRNSIMNKCDYDYYDFDTYIEDGDVTEGEILEAFKNLEVEVKFK